MAKTQTIDERPQAQPEAVLEAPTCQHHWLIDTPRGAMSVGRCKRCGEQREFRNSTTDYLWEDESNSGYNAWRGVRNRRNTGSGESEDDGGVSTSPGGVTALMV